MFEALKRLLAPPPPSSTPSDEAMARLRKDVTRSNERMHAIERKLSELTALLTSQHQDLIAQLRPERQLDRQELPSLPSTLRKITRGAPVVIGPWRGEVGWELLYWIPFLRWLSEQGLAADSAIAISRGGPRSWYERLAARYVDVSELPEEWRLRSREHTTQKQREIDPHDAAAAEHVAKQHGLSSFVHLHPSTMYRMLQPYWTGVAPASYLHQLTVVDRLNPPALPDGVRLPDRFVAVKMYDSRVFRFKGDAIAWARATIEELARRVDVVLLNPATPIDDHPPLTVAASPRVHTIDPMTWGHRNLDAQTAIVARASGLLATYGGFSYLGPLVGVPTVAVYSNADAVLGHHLELAGEMFDRLEPGSYAALHVRHFRTLQLAFS